MKTLHEVAEEICPYRLEDYDPAIDVNTLPENPYE